MKPEVLTAALLKIQVFWDVMLGAVPTLPKEHSTFFMGVKQFKKNSKRREILAQ
jgi:hypothetical protein